MTVHRMCEQGHDWIPDSSSGETDRCPFCGGAPRRLPTSQQPVPEALAGILELLPSLLTSMGDALVVADRDGNFLFFNSAAERLLRRPAAQVAMDRWTEHFGIYHADTLVPVATDELPLVRAIRGLETNQFELLYCNENVPEGVYASVTGRPLWDACGVLRGGFIVMRDITAQKRNEQDLRRTSMYLAALMQAMPDSIYFKDRDHRYLAINQALANQFGLTDPEEAVDRTAADFFAPSYAAEIAEDEDRVMRGEKVTEKESYQVWADGRARWVATTRMPLVDEEDDVVGTIGMTRDITEAKRAAEALRDSEARFRNLFDASPDAIFVEDYQGYILDANPRACLLQGIPYRQLIGKHILDLTPVEFRERVMRGFNEMVQRTRTQVQGFTHRPDGTAIPVELSASHIEYAGQQALLLHVRDITERTQAEADLRKSEERFELAVQGSTDGIWDWDLGDNRVYFSPRWKQMLGYEDHEIPGRYEEWQDRLHPEDHERALKTIQDYLAGKTKQYELEHRLRHKDGTYRWILARGVAVRDAQGNVLRMAGSHTDIHQRKLDEERLRAAQQAAEAANHAKGQFLAKVSHELRTPLNGIHGLTELLHESAENDQQREQLAMIRGCTQALLCLIGDLLDFSRADAGSFHLHPEPFEFRSELGIMVKSLAIQAAQKGLLLACRVEPDVPGQWRADWPRLRQVLINLLGNSLKFTESGEVILRVRRVHPRPEDQGLAPVLFEVRDTGIGIPEDKLQVIFAPFIQVDDTTTRRHGGSGLGLSIAQRLVELMGGRIEVESTVGQGSTFRVEIPVEVIGPRGNPPGVALRDRVALVVEPNPTHRELLAEFLGEIGMVALLGSSPAEARTLAAGQGVEVLIVTSDLLGESPDLARLQPGLRVLQMLPLGHKIVDLPEDIPLRVVGLPLVLEDLLDLLRQLLEGTPRKRFASAEKASPPASRSLRVLVAEDTLVNQRFIRTLLERQGHSVQVVDNGQAAVEQVRRNSFDVILMDVSMPIMDGLEATRLIRLEQAHESWRIPIIALTAHASLVDREACLQAGMDDFVPKPVDPKLLTCVLTRLTALSSPTIEETAP